MAGPPVGTGCRTQTKFATEVTAMGASAGKDLPISDYDELTEGALRERVRGLTEQQLRRLLDYETEHAKRPAVTAVLSTRLDDLAHGAKPPTGSAATDPGSPGPAGRRRATRACHRRPRHRRRARRRTGTRPSPRSPKATAAYEPARRLRGGERADSNVGS